MSQGRRKYESIFFHLHRTARFSREKPLYYVDAKTGKRIMLLKHAGMQKIVNEKAATPSAQRNFLNTVRAMFKCAMKEGRVGDNHRRPRPVQTTKDQDRRRRAAESKTASDHRGDADRRHQALRDNQIRQALQHRRLWQPHARLVRCCRLPQGAPERPARELPVPVTDYASSRPSN